MEGTYSGVRTHFLVMVTVLQLCLQLSVKKKKITGNSLVVLGLPWWLRW